MPNELSHQIPGNIPDGIIRNQQLDLSKLTSRIVANELFECSLTGEASELYGELGPNLISCKLENVVFPSGVSHFDAKDTVFVMCEVRGKFERILSTKCAFRAVSFDGAALRDTVFVDSFFEDVTFAYCDFSVTTFKTNVFRNCSFFRCSTTNKLFEHCLFYHCKFSSITLQEASVLQNFGIYLGDIADPVIYRAETGEPIEIAELSPKNRLERISLAYFLGRDLNESQDLLETVQFKMEDATRTNILHIVTGIRQLASFLLALYSESKIILFFPLQLFWSIDQFLNLHGSERELPLSVSEALEISSARLHKLYEEVCLSMPPSGGLHLLIREEFNKEDLQITLTNLGLDVHVAKFRVFNSPSLAEIISPDTFETLLAATLILSTRFRAEVDRYHAERKLLDIGTRLITDGKANPTSAYQALVVLNVPKLVYIRLSARINLSIIGKLRRMIVALLEEEPNEPRDVPYYETVESPQVTILFLASNSVSAAPLQLDQEVKAIDESLRIAGSRMFFKLEQAWAVGERELQDSLLRYKPDIVHLSAHGAISGKPLLERGTARDVNPSSNRDKEGTDEADEEAIIGFGQVFANAGRSLRCIILNTCHSARISAVLSPHVDCIVGMSSSISDTAAIRFSWAFYNAIAYGKSIKASFDLAVAQLALAGYKQSQIPQIFSGRCDPDDIVLVRSDKR